MDASKMYAPHHKNMSGGSSKGAESVGRRGNGEYMQVNARGWAGTVQIRFLGKSNYFITLRVLI